MDLALSFNELRESPEKALAQISRYGPPLLSIILVAVIAWLLASLTWTLIPRPVSKPPPAVATAAQPDDMAPQSTDIADIVKRHLFGVFDDSVKPEVVDFEGVDPYEGPLKLLGTLAADDPARSLAIIEDGGEATVFAIGDSIRNSVTLKSVAAKEVLIIERGEPKRLDLPKADEGTSAAPRRGRTASRGSRPSRPQPARQTAVSTGGVAKLGDFIRPQPVFANGKQRGYRVYPGRKRDQFAALGLKPGDLITEINGSPLDDPARGLEVFRSIASSSQVSVTIERNGQPTSLVLDTSQINLGGASDR